MDIQKRYVKVMSVTDEDGKTKPLIVYWEDGKKFVVDQIYDIRPAASLKGGGQGIRYLIRIGNTDTAIFYEEPKWFVEEKVGVH